MVEQSIYKLNHTAKMKRLLSTANQCHVMIRHLQICWKECRWGFTWCSLPSNLIVCCWRGRDILGDYTVQHYSIRMRMWLFNLWTLPTMHGLPYGCFWHCLVSRHWTKTKLKELFLQRKSWRSFSPVKKLSKSSLAELRLRLNSDFTVRKGNFILAQTVTSK